MFFCVTCEKREKRKNIYRYLYVYIRFLFLFIQSFEFLFSEIVSNVDRKAEDLKNVETSAELNLVVLSI